MQKPFPFLQTVASSKQNKTKQQQQKKWGIGEYSITPLNKGSPSSEVHVSGRPKLHSAKTD